MKFSLAPGLGVPVSMMMDGNAWEGDLDSFLREAFFAGHCGIGARWTCSGGRSYVLVGGGGDRGGSTWEPSRGGPRFNVFRHRFKWECARRSELPE